MNALCAVSTGAGLGLAFYGGLWLTVGALRAERARWLLAPSRLLRLALAALVFYGLTREGAATALEGLGGFWLSRVLLLRRAAGEG